MADQQVTEVYREFRCECEDCLVAIPKNRCTIRYVHATTDTNEEYGTEHYAIHRWYHHAINTCEQYANECHRLRKTAD